MKASEVSKRLVEEMERRAADPRKVWGLPYFCPGLNTLSGGAHRGQMSLLGARTSVGKSFWLAQDAYFKAQYLLTPEGKARFPDQSIKLILREMSQEQFQARIVAQHAEVSDRRMRAGALTPFERDKYRRAAKEVGELPIEYLDAPKSIDDILNFLDQGSKTAWFGVDYIGIMPTGNSQVDGSPYRRVSMLSEAFRDYTKSGPPGLILCQLNRQIEMRKPEERRPQLSDFRDSGTLEQDASGVVMTLFRPDLYVKEADENARRAKPAELAVLKHRTGPIGVIELHWVPNLPGYVDTSKLVDDLEAA